MDGTQNNVDNDALLQAIPEEMRAAISMLISQAVEKQVEEKVAAEVEKMQKEV